MLATTANATMIHINTPQNAALLYNMIQLLFYQSCSIIKLLPASSLPNTVYIVVNAG